jgi:hypothetical protein
VSGVAIEDQIILRFTPREAAPLQALLKEDGFNFDGPGLKAWIMDQANPKNPNANYGRRFGRAINNFVKENPEAVETLKKGAMDAGLKIITKMAMGKK